MDDDENKYVVDGKVSGEYMASMAAFWMLQGDLTPLIDLLNSDFVIPRQARVNLASMLKETSLSEFQLVCKRRHASPGRPAKSAKEFSRDLEIGVRVRHLIKNGEKYESAKHTIAERFGVSAPTVDKAYTAINQLLKDHKG